MLVHPFNAFKFINLNTVDNRVKLIESGYKVVYASLDIFSKTALAKDYVPTSRIMSFNLLSTEKSTSSEALRTLGKSNNSPCHVHVVYFFKIPSHKKCSLILKTLNILPFKQLTQGHFILTPLWLLMALCCTNYKNFSTPFS